MKMICAKCRCGDVVSSRKRYLCSEGHVLCVNCIKKGSERRKCPVCGWRIVQKLNVFDDDVSRLQITQVNSSSSLINQEVIQIEPCKRNFMEMESHEGMAATKNHRGSSKSLVDVSSVESYGDIPHDGIIFERSQLEVHKNCRDFPFQVSYDSIEIKKDPRERQMDHFYEECESEEESHEHLITVNGYDEPRVVPYIVLNPQNEPNFLEERQETVPDEHLLQYFRLVSASDDDFDEQRAGESIPPIFTLISMDSKIDLIDENVQKSPESPDPPSINSLLISRAPIFCPISSCNKLQFKSFIIKHIQTDHPRVLLKTISPGFETHYLWDTKINKKDSRKCHIVYLLKDRIRDLGNTEFRNYLPIMVMTTKFKASSIFGHSITESHEKSHFLIWLTGLAIKEVPVHYTLTLSSDRNSPKKLHFSNKLYSWRNGQSTKGLYDSGNALILTHQQFTQLRHDGKEMIRVKIVIH